jgi:DeoR family lactose phosphotransferase system repressor
MDKKLHKIERLQIIKDYVHKESFTNISSISELFSNVAEITIRRDLKDLQDENEIKLIHGGIKSMKSFGIEVHRDKKIYQNIDIKKRLGIVAAKLVKDGETIYVSPSTTCEYLVEYIDKKVKLFTNCLYTYRKAIKNPNIDAILLGGKMREKTKAFIGPVTFDSLKKQSFNKSFISVNTVNTQNELTNSNEDEAQIEVKAMDNSHEIIVLIEHHKLLLDEPNKISFYNLFDCDTLVINKEVEQNKLEKIKNKIKVKMV